MVWRIHFTAEDLERIQVRPTLGPLAETVKAMSLLRCPRQPRAPYRQWRGQVKGRLTPQMTALTALIPPGSKGVDLSMLTGTAATMEQGVQALLAVPREQLLLEMEFTDREHKLPAEVWAVAETAGRPGSSSPRRPWPPTRCWSSRTGPGSTPACTPSTWPGSGRWRPADRTGCWPRCRASGSAGGHRCSRCWCPPTTTCR